MPSLIGHLKAVFHRLMSRSKSRGSQTTDVEESDPTLSPAPSGTPKQAQGLTSITDSTVPISRRVTTRRPQSAIAFVVSIDPHCLGHHTTRRPRSAQSAYRLDAYESLARSQRRQATRRPESVMVHPALPVGMPIVPFVSAIAPRLRSSLTSAVNQFF